MELPSLDAHCGAKGCGRLDFLPYTCDACKRVFCADHYAYANHNCTESYKKNHVTPECPICGQTVPYARGEDPNIKMEQHIASSCATRPARTKKTRNACAVKGCKTREAVPVICPHCKLNFCFAHRFDSDHNCKPVGASQRARAAAEARRPSRTAATGTAKRTGNGKAREKAKAPVDLRSVGASLDADRRRRQDQAVATDEAIARALSEQLNGPGATAAAPPARGRQAAAGAAGGVAAPRTREEEEDELQRALAASMQEGEAKKSDGCSVQ